MKKSARTFEWLLAIASSAAKIRKLPGSPLREFGNVGLVKETTHAVRRWASLEQILQDFRAAFRILTKSPGFSAAAITLVAMGIGWNTTIYSIHSRNPHQAGGGRRGPGSGLFTCAIPVTWKRSSRQCAARSATSIPGSPSPS